MKIGGSEIPTKPLNRMSRTEPTENTEIVEGKFTRAVLLVLLGVMLGLPGFGLALVIISPTRTFLDLLLLLPVFYFSGGFTLGIIDKDFWPLAGWVAWGPVCVGIVYLFREPGTSATLFIPLLLAFGGGYMGSKIRSWLNRE
jgi:hypothetical protein